MRLRTFDLQDRLLDLAIAACRVAEALPGKRVGRHIASQLVGSATSPAANYAEARAAESRRDFVHKMKLCLKELRETLVWLELERRLEVGESGEVNRTVQECEELVAIFVKSIATAERGW